MAASDAKPIPKKNTAYRVTFPIYDNDGDLVTGAAGLDSEVSKDGGTFADCTNEATEIATASGMYYLDLTSTEMNADTVAIIVKTSSTNAKTTPIVLYPEEAGDIRVDVTQISGDTTAADNAESFFDGTGYAGTGNVIPTVTTVTGGATAAALATVDGVADSILVSVAALNDISPAEVNAEVLDVLTVDTFAEPASVPAATASLKDKIGWLMTLARNRITQTNTTQTLYADDGTTPVGASTVSDDGTEFVKAEWS